MSDRDLMGQRFTGRHAFLCEMAGDLGGASTLDIGCGFGWFERYALEHGAGRAVGLELSEVLVERARIREYAAHSAKPSPKACVTIFAEAVAVLQDADQVNY